VSAPAALTRTVSGPVRLTSPALTAAPGPAKTGRLSPVSSARSISLALDHRAVDRHPAAGFHPHKVARGEIGDRRRDLDPIDQFQRARHFERGELLRRRSRGGPRPVIQIAPEQQEEGQRQGGVEIGMPATHGGLVKRHAAGQDQAPARSAHPC
jgi:hypothetical protein